jgi:hypothetical protein
MTQSGLLHDADSTAPAPGANRSVIVSAPADTDDTASGDLARCGWCGGTQFRFISEESGRVYCPCGGVYNPVTGCWAPGRPERRQRPPAPLPVTAA